MKISSSFYGSLICICLLFSHSVVDAKKSGKSTKKKSKKSAKSGKSTKCDKKAKKTEGPPQRCENVVKPTPQVQPPMGDLTDPAFLGRVQRCSIALALSGFNVFDIPNYSRWFHDETKMWSFETGVYVGEDGIAEYVSIFGTDIYTDGVYVFPNENPESSILPLYAEGDKCVISTAQLAASFANPKYRPEESWDTVFGYRFEFNITSFTGTAASIMVDSIYVYQLEGAQEKLAETGYSDVLGERTCTNMMEFCPDVFYEKNCYETIDDCLEDQIALPASDGGLIMGKSVACRTLHASFVSTNPLHCPHISTVPLWDDNCNLKCQEVHEDSILDYWHPVEIGFFEQFAVAAGITEGVRIPSVLQTAP